MSNELRALEVARLDALQASLWDNAQGGDARAANTILKLIDRRCRLLGLYRPPAEMRAAAALVMTRAELSAYDGEDADADELQNEGAAFGAIQPRQHRAGNTEPVDRGRAQRRPRSRGPVAL